MSTRVAGRSVVFLLLLACAVWLAGGLPLARWFGHRAPPVVASAAVVTAPVAEEVHAAAPLEPPPVPVQAPVAVPVEAERTPPVPLQPGLIDQIGSVQAQLMLLRLQRELAQAQADIARLAGAGDERAAPVQALLDRDATTADPRPAARSSRLPPGAIAVQAVFGRDGGYSAQVSLGGEPGSVVQVGDRVRAYRVAEIRDGAVTLAPLQGGASLVLRPGAPAVTP